MLSECLDHATPAQRVVQVFGRHPVESSHPLFQPRMVSVRVLERRRRFEQGNTPTGVGKTATYWAFKYLNHNILFK